MSAMSLEFYMGLQTCSSKCSETRKNRKCIYIFISKIMEWHIKTDREKTMDNEIKKFKT